MDRENIIQSLLVLALSFILLFLLFSCFSAGGGNGQSLRRERSDDSFLDERKSMVEYQIKRRGIVDRRVLEAMAKVPRHLFVPERYRSESYRDGPLPIGEGQTISQPYIVALMTEALRPRPEDKVLEIGTGSGYQAAVLAEIVKTVYTIEIIPELGKAAEEKLKSLGYDNCIVRIGDGYKGWPENAPFDGVIVTAAPDHIPEPLLDQLKIGGRLVIPVGDFSQDLILLEKTPDGIRRKVLAPVRFVPMTGEAENK